MFCLLLLCFTVYGQKCDTALAVNLEKGKDIELCIFFSKDTTNPTKFKIKVDEYARLSIPTSKDIVSNSSIYSWVTIRTQSPEPDELALPDEGCPYTDCAEILEKDICDRVESCDWVDSSTTNSTCDFSARTNRRFVSSCPQIYEDAGRKRYAPFANLIIELDKGNLHRIRIDNSCSNCVKADRVISQNALRLVASSSTAEYAESLAEQKILTEEQQVDPSFCMCGKTGSKTDFRYFVAFRGTDKNGNILTSDVFSYSNFVGATVNSVYDSLVG
eukprot:GEMP01025157.1.p1 GENE.GEMP01025157.1~~GEMP01025157.1.p1  ORF type:complete len:274 (+),score=27.50 GEMP01025157.1:32-853(+)